MTDAGTMDAARDGGAALDEVRVLVVDDREDNIDVIAALLEQPGVRFLRASSGEEALELMRGAERTRWVPIIFVTAATPEPVRVFRGYEAGAVDFLFKPLDARLLQSKVSVFIELYRQRRQLAQQLVEHQTVLHTAELMIGVLSHDLRSPLNAIVTAGELLPRSYPDDPQIGRIAERIRSASKRMTRLIEQLLDFATARLGGLPLNAQQADLRIAAHDLGKVEPGAPRKHDIEEEKVGLDELIHAHAFFRARRGKDGVPLFSELVLDCL